MCVFGRRRLNVMKENTLSIFRFNPNFVILICSEMPNCKHRLNRLKQKSKAEGSWTIEKYI